VRGRSETTNKSDRIDADWLSEQLRLGALHSVYHGSPGAKAGPLKELYDRCVAGGVREEIAKLTLARKLASVALRLWKKGELWDPTKLTMQAT
jgi:hypothetical protein